MKFQEILDLADKYQEKILRTVEKVYGYLKPQYMLIALLLLHWFSTSGSVYNMINNAPPYGVNHGKNGQEKLEFLAEGTHSQYSTEGFIAGALTCAASIFFITGLQKVHTGAHFSTIMMFIVLGLGSVFLIYMMYKLKG